MAEPFQTTRLDSYAQDLLRQSYGATPISPDILAQYGQGMAQQVQPPPQVQQYSGLRPSQERQQYIGLIEQRLNQLTEAAGGMQELIDTGIYDQVRQKAERDVKMMYGDIPEQEPRVIDVQGNQLVVGGPVKTPIVLPSKTQQEQEQLALKKAKAELAQSEQKASAEASKTKQETASSSTGLNLSVKIFDNVLGLAKEMRSSPLLPETVGGGDPITIVNKTIQRNLQGTPQYDFATNARRLKSGAFAQAVTMLKGMGALSNAEGSAITNALTDVDNLGQSPEQYQKRLDEFISLMESLVASKKKELSSIQEPQINLESFDIRNVPIVNEQQQAQPSAPQMAPSPTAPAEPARVSSPGAIQFVRDPQTGRMIRQQ